MGRIFGTDGARGVAGAELTAALAMDIGRAAGMVVRERTGKERPLFLIGEDTRLSSDMLTSAVAAGLCSVGVDVLHLGVLPTPAVAYLTVAYGADAGVMLSASHNPYSYNGIKLFGSEGFKLTDAQEEEIEAIVLDGALPYYAARGEAIGRITRRENAHSDYVEHLVSTVSHPLTGLRVAVDCANGSASATAEELFARLGVDATFFHNSPDGKNINEDCGSTHVKHLGEIVQAGKFDLGVAFDGDADRCLAVDEHGEIVDGDMLLAIFAKALRAEGKLPGDCVVVTVMSNLGFFNFAKAEGLTTQVTKVGDRYVLENMRAGGYSLGGENSGHVIFLDYMTTGDGQLSAIKLLEAMAVAKQPLSTLHRVMKKLPQVLLGVSATPQMKAALDESEPVQACIAQMEAELGERGRILVRVSGTEPLIRVMVEGEDFPEILQAAQRIAASITNTLG